LKPLAVRPLIMMGQSSLQVFCVHLLFCFAGLTLMGNASMMSGWRQLALLSATFTAMLITAKLFSKSEAKHERPPKKGIPSGSGTQTNPPAQGDVARSIEGPMPASATSTETLAR
jgi:hypothetical protein